MWAARRLKPAVNRLFLSAVLWVMRHGGTWRVLPGRFGKHDSVRKRALRWAQKGTWQRLFAAVRLPEVEAMLLDFTIRREHQRASGQVKKKRCGDEVRGRSRGGLTTKLHAAVDEAGRPHALLLRPGQQADCTRALELLAAAGPVRHVLADKGYDTNAIVEAVEQAGAEVVIPSKKTARIAV